MPRLPLVGGAYESRSIIGNAQRAINYFPEPNRRDSPAPMTHYQRPALRPMIDAPEVAPVRALWQASNERCFCVIGSKVYNIEQDFSLVLLGSINVSRTSPVSFADNGTEALIVDGSPSGWVMNINSGLIHQIVDPAFNGGNRADFLDTFILWNKRGTRRFGATKSEIIEPFDPLSYGTKSSFPDILQTLMVRRNEVALFGRLKGEIWYNVGGITFPFARLPGTSIEHGINAIYSLAASDVSMFWLSHDLEGQKGLVLRLRAYQTTVISNYALSTAIAKMARVDDAIGYCYQQGGHSFYVLNFPSANQTWVFDDSISDPELAWHQRCWTDNNGILNRDRGNCFAVIHDVPCVGDWENGQIYKLDQDSYTDRVAGIEYAISCVRTFPHITQGFDAAGRLVETDGRSVKFDSFIADMEVGLGEAGSQVGLRWSDDRGRTWGNTVLRPNGEPGEYQTNEKWDGLGTARNRLFELSHSINGPAALNGAYVNATVQAR